MNKSISLAIFFFILLAGCSENDANQKQSIDQNEEELLAISSEVFSNLLDLDWVAFSTYVHEDEGLTYSPYSDVGEDTGIDDDLHFEKETIKNFGESDQQYSWYWDQSGAEYKDTPNGFVENVIKTRADMNSPEYALIYGHITFNDSAYENDQQSNTIYEVYPEAYYVEYYHEPGKVEYDGKQQALRFVYEKIDGEWYLVALVRGAHNP